METLIISVEYTNIVQKDIFSIYNLSKPTNPMGYNWATKDMENNKETQSRREFFKSAARKSLPIFGVIILSAAYPFSLHAMQSTSCTNRSCMNQCDGSCTKWCNGTCLTSCEDKCKGTVGK